MYIEVIAHQVSVVLEIQCILILTELVLAGKISNT